MGGTVAIVGAQRGNSVSTEEADTDLALIRAIARGDRQALSEIYLRHGQSLLHYLMHFTNDPGTAEELVQDTLVAVWKNAHSYRGDSRPRAWLFGIARRRAGKSLRHSELPRAELAELDEMPAPELEPEPASRPALPATR